MLLFGGGCSNPLLYNGHCVTLQFVGSSPIIGGVVSRVCGVVMNGGSVWTARGLHVGERVCNSWMSLCVCSGWRMVMYVILVF